MIHKVLDLVERRIVPFSLLSTLVSLGTMILALTLYAITGHYYHDDRFFPTISSTEHLAPEHYVYAIGFSYCGIALCLSISVVHLRMIAPMVKERRWAFWTNYVSLALGLIAGISFALQTYWPVGHFMHSGGSAAFFYLGLIYCILVTIVTRTPECRSSCFEKMWRAKLCMASAYALSVGFFGLGLLDSYANRKTFTYYYVETLSEWCAVYAFILFFSTYGFDATEYRRMKEEMEEKKEYIDKEEGEETRNSDIVLSELGDDVPNFAPQDNDKNTQGGLSAVREEIEELLTVVTVPREEDVITDVEIIEENVAPLIKKGDDLSKKVEMVISTLTHKTIPGTYVALIVFSVTEFLFLKMIF